jgi:hypothetical protein
LLYTSLSKCMRFSSLNYMVTHLKQGFKSLFISSATILRVQVFLAFISFVQPMLKKFDGVVFKLTMFYLKVS